MKYHIDGYDFVYNSLMKNIKLEDLSEEEHKTMMLELNEEPSGFGL